MPEETKARLCDERSGQTGIPKEFLIQMKRTFALVLMLASGMVLSAAAQTQPAPAAAPAAVPAKIAVVAFQLAVAQTNEGQRDFGDLQKKYAPKEAALKTLSEEVDNLTKQLQAQGATLSEGERANRAKVIDDKKKQLDRDSEDARNDFQADIQEMYNALASKVYDVMSSYAEQQGFTLVLDISQQQTPVLFSANGTNITKQVIDAYNVKSGVPAPPAQPAGLREPGSSQAGSSQACRAKANRNALNCSRYVAKAPSRRSLCRAAPLRATLPVDKFVEFFGKAAGKALNFPLATSCSILIQGLTRFISIGK